MWSFFVRDDFPKEVDGAVKGVKVVRMGGGVKDYVKVSDEVSGKKERELRQGREKEHEVGNKAATNMPRQ